MTCLMKSLLHTEFCGRAIPLPQSEFRTWQLHLEADDVFEASELSPPTHVRRISVTRTAPTRLWKIFYGDGFYSYRPQTERNTKMHVK
jgi:hypothetical protein